jgi:AbrB family looped-hinge helix DNA binding protein
MKIVRAKITRSGQVTFPAEARKALGVELGDEVDFRIDEGNVRVERVPLQLEDVFGSLKPPRPDFNIDEAIREAKEERAQRIMQSVRGE